ncbi:hypothetical protein GT923_08935 [Streptococcus pyogenes]|uniref:Uncharacterized protein n=3 Tax=Streptococcus pyogenes TaxID=1314 RepID=A0A5S4TKT6_STRPY|nr:hypothetical protein SpyM3_1756 [Streptococcus pyogenes MGAS315]ABF32947.1 hypothetical protein MGAS9429_Spy1760 [Streptococcus pyogenes MGAS9429]ABF36836.1 hypothetical protein MGAS2096_Spy1784 [Streptococcus pyogenes MGAS2096]AIG48017.1 hypothetical protein STAB902_09435 [Streptococcus pyogenes STAB902]AKZ52882.1 hypothetical protein SD90_08165 [Streptococcus pyogenes]EIK42693.1 hypothetical protein SPYOHK_08775 [Streptococcus pyogenes HKU QMH11M0907901]MDV6872525.1 hypothetical protein 
MTLLQANLMHLVWRSLLHCLYLYAFLKLKPVWALKKLTNQIIDTTKKAGNTPSLGFSKQAYHFYQS